MTPEIHIASSDYRKLSDDELIRHFRETKDYVYMKHIFRRYAHIVYGICLAALRDAEKAKEKMEEVFINMSDAFTRQDIDDFRPWLFKYLRQQHLLPNVQVNGDEHLRAISSANDTDAPAEPSAHDLAVAVSHLSPEQKTCLELFYRDNKTVSEIAELTDYSPIQVRQWLYSGKQGLVSDLELHHHTH